jgi:hypothetical protein
MLGVAPWDWLGAHWDGDRDRPARWNLNMA